jgi:two-component sensor histidine kinase
MIKINLKTIILITILLWVGIICHAQEIIITKKEPYQKVFVNTDNFGVSYLEKLETSLTSLKIDSLYFDILNDLAYYWHTRNLNTALDHTKRGLRLTNINKDTLWEGRFQITQGAILLRMEKLDSAYLVLEQAKTKVLEKDLPFLNTQLGYVFERRGQIDRAADYALISLDLGKKLVDKKAIALAYSDLSNLFWKQSKFEKGLEYGLKSTTIFEERNIHDLDYDFTLYVVGNNYLGLKRYEEALKFYEQSIIIGERYGFYNNLSDVYISLTDLNAYLGKYEIAAKAGENAIRYAELLENNFMIMRSWLSMGKLYNLQGKYSVAIESLKKCISVATDNFGDEYYLSQAYEALGRAYAGNHNYQEAYQAFDKYDVLKKEIFTAEADQRISLLHTEFEVAQKESTIKIQEAKLKQQQITQTLFIIIAALLFLLLLLIYIAYQNIRKKRVQLQQQNQEKEFLLKEIHHRVKNNLGIVSSLLALQSAQLKDQKVIDVMQEIENRVYSMSMIHQRLYQGKNLAAIEMKDYFINLGKHVLDSFGAEGNVMLECTMDKLELDVDTAVPLGLIVNELLTNALKHAFPDNTKGKIKIGLRKIDALTFELEVVDNGIGKSTDDHDGFGTQLIKLLIQQLDGKIKYKSTKGTSIFFEFKIQEAA